MDFERLIPKKNFNNCCAKPSFVPKLVLEQDLSVKL